MKVTLAFAGLVAFLTAAQADEVIINKGDKYDTYSSKTWSSPDCPGYVCLIPDMERKLDVLQKQQDLILRLLCEDLVPHGNGRELCAQLKH